MPRRDFDLPPQDVEYLDTQYPEWEAIRDGTANWLLIPRFEVPPGYSLNVTAAALRIEAGYPDAQIDMVYFSPPLLRNDGKAAANTDASATICGAVYQRWSRHRSSQNPWRPGVDDVSTHLMQVRHWLEREFLR